MLSISVIKEVLSEWSYWQKLPPTTIPRDVLKGNLDWHADLIWVVQGVRRSGKSTLLAQIMTKYQLPPQNCFFINFEDPRLSENLNDKLLDQVVGCAEETIPKNQNSYFFFDEIQNVKRWEKWLHRHVERPQKKFFVITGSNASLLAGDLATALTGRHRTIELFPFDYSEFQTAKPGMAFENYLNSGGFPRVLTVSSPEKLLREYFTDIIERDVRRHVAARNPLALTQIAKAVFESTGSETSLRNLAKTFGVAADTVHSYLDACIAAYLILPCSYFTFSERKRTARPNKYYPIDTGLHRAVITRGGADRGKLLETIVFHRLRKNYRDTFYWRGKGEVDFVTIDGAAILPFQVSWDGLKERHHAAIEDFKKQHPKAEAVQMITRENVEKFLLG